MTNALVETARKQADFALETFGYLSDEYRAARQRLYNQEDRLAERLREERDAAARLAWRRG